MHPPKHMRHASGRVEDLAKKHGNKGAKGTKGGKSKKTTRATSRKA